MKKQRSSSPQPRLGVFWFIPWKDRHRFAAKSLPHDQVANIGGIKTFPESHEEVWSEIARIDGHLGSFEYEYFPRGRVNWIEERDQFLLLADRQILRLDLHLVVIERFRLDAVDFQVMSDSHYQTNSLPSLLR